PGGSRPPTSPRTPPTAKEPCDEHAHLDPSSRGPSRPRRPARSRRAGRRVGRALPRRPCSCPERHARAAPARAVAGDLARAALAVWTLVLLGIGGLGLAPTLYTAQWDGIEPVAAMIFSLQIILVLFAMLLVVPALSAGSINGDRTAGTLATLQASLLSPLEIVLGKLLAGFLTGLAFLVLALPSVVPIALLGGIGPLYFLRAVLVIVLLTLCVTAVGLGLSAITQRQLGSVVLAYVIVFGVTAVLPIAWGSSAIFLQQEREVTSYRSSYSDDPGAGRCTAETRTEEVPRIDLSMPLLWGNPVELLAETAPPVPEAIWRHEGENLDVLRLVKSGVRAAAVVTHPSQNNFCTPHQAGYPADLGDPPNRPVWPMGLGLWLLAGGVSSAVA